MWRRWTVQFASCLGLLCAGCLQCWDTHLVSAACIVAGLRQLVSNTDPNRYLQWEVWKSEKRRFFWRIWSSVHRAAKAASSIGYQSQHSSSSLLTTVAAQGSSIPSLLWRKHSLTKSHHKALSRLFQNRDHYEDQKIWFWWACVRWILKILYSFYKIFGGCLRLRKNGTWLSMCDTQQHKILSITHAGWSGKDLSVMFSSHMVFT